MIQETKGFIISDYNELCKKQKKSKPSITFIAKIKKSSKNIDIDELTRIRRECSSAKICK